MRVERWRSAVFQTLRRKQSPAARRREQGTEAKRVGRQSPARKNFLTRGSYARSSVYNKVPGKNKGGWVHAMPQTVPLLRFLEQCSTGCVNSEYPIHPHNSTMV